jgi:hypothetical protein
MVANAAPQGEMVMRPVLMAAGPKVPTPGTSGRCQATPAPPAPCVEMNGTLESLAVRGPDAVVPTTWIVAVPRKVATPPL